MIGWNPVEQPAAIRLTHARRECESTDEIAARVLAEEHALRLHREGSMVYCPRCNPGGPAARALDRKARVQPRVRTRKACVGNGRETWVRTAEVTWTIDMPRPKYAKTIPDWARLLPTRPGETARVEVLPSDDAAKQRAKRLRAVLRGYDVASRGTALYARFVGERE